MQEVLRSLLTQGAVNSEDDVSGASSGSVTVSDRIAMLHDLDPVESEVIAELNAELQTLVDTAEARQTSGKGEAIIKTSAVREM